MLPFLKKRQESSGSGLIVKTRASDESQNEPDQDDDKDASINACAQDLIDAVHARDVAAVSSALRSAFEILESQPSEEPEPHSYDAQNQAAAQGQD